MDVTEDIYKTINGTAEGRNRDKGSKFLAYAFHVENEAEIKEHLSGLRKRYYDATHHCYAWRLGAKGESFRANDDGEPSGTAGRPILGQLLSKELTYTLVVVVRYFGGTKLGVPGLIAAYKEAAAEVLDDCEILELTEDAYYDITFGYLVMNDVMKVIKELSPKIISQEFDNECKMSLAVRRGHEELFLGKIKDIEGLKEEFIKYR